MLFKKENLPEEDDIVVCTVKKILHNSIFVYLDEYLNKEGMLYISEVAPGRIRNIRDYVKPDKKIVCKVLRVDPRSGHIDLSLRRVSLMARQKKLDEYKQELKAEKLLLSISKQKKILQKDIYQKLAKPLMDNFGSLTNAFLDVFKNGEKTLLSLKIPKPIAASIVKAVKEKIKLPEVKIDAVLKLINYEADGINRIKEVIKKTLALAESKNQKIEFRYISAPNYNMHIKAKDYKEAERILQETIAGISSQAQKTNTLIEWQKKS